MQWTHASVFFKKNMGLKDVDFNMISVKVPFNFIYDFEIPNTSINIALEFVNTGNDFCGVEHNVIPAGTKFYLVANLDPTTNTTYKVQNPETPWADGTDYINQVIKPIGGAFA